MTISDPLPNSNMPAETETIWQFMPLPALLSILQKSQLFFRRLSDLEDPDEGRFSQAILNNLDESLHESGMDEGADPWTGERIEAAVRDHLYVNCWHLNPVASSEMWEQYARLDGVAIKSTVGSLLKTWKTPEYRITMNGVRYLDRAVSLTEVFPPFHKKLNFTYEKEFRASLILPTSGRHSVRHGGVYVTVDLRTLIEDVHLYPSMPPWVAEVVATEVRMRLGMDCVPAAKPPGRP